MSFYLIHPVYTPLDRSQNAQILKVDLHVFDHLSLFQVPDVPQELYPPAFYTRLHWTDKFFATIPTRSIASSKTSSSFSLSYTSKIN